VKTVEGQAGKGSLLHEAPMASVIFLRGRAVGLLIFFICLNFIIGLSISLFLLSS